MTESAGQSDIGWLMSPSQKPIPSGGNLTGWTSRYFDTCLFALKGTSRPRCEAAARPLRWMHEVKHNGAGCRAGVGPHITVKDGICRSQSSTKSES